MHSLSGCSATVSGYHISFRIFIEHNTKIIQPLNGIRCFHNQFFQKFRSCSKMSSAESIQIMLYR